MCVGGGGGAGVEVVEERKKAAQSQDIWKPPYEIRVTQKFPFVKFDFKLPSTAV